MPYFSTIIPSYNRADLIGATLDSVLAQDFTDHEIIVVDDGSTDATMDVLARYGGKIRLYRRQNGGPGAARNFALTVATGEYVAFLDSDDLLFPWAFRTLKTVIDQCGGPAIVTGDLPNFHDPRELDGIAETPLVVETAGDFLASSLAWFAPSGTVVKASELRAVGGMTEAVRVCEDVDLWLRLGTARGFVTVRSPHLCGYRMHTGGISRSVVKRAVGAAFLIGEEKSGRYPGGADRRGQRRAYIASHVRPISLEVLKHGACAAGVRLYCHTFAWHLRQMRAKYLAAFPVMAAAGMIRGFFRRQPRPDAPAPAATPRSQPPCP